LEATKGADPRFENQNLFAIYPSAFYLCIFNYILAGKIKIADLLIKIN